MRRRILIVTAVFFLTGCSPQPQVDYGRTIIDTVGTFPCFHKQLLVKLSRASGGKLSYSFENAKIGVGSAVPAVDESAPWIVFPESTNKVWIYDGAKDVTLVELYADGGTKFTSSQVVPDLLSRAPSEFAQRLPK